jgi:hypothetical protein
LSKKIEIIIGEEKGIAELFEDKSPKFVEALWNALPLEGIVSHANFSGEEMSIATPELTRIKENIVHKTCPGDLGYGAGTGSGIIVYYGSLSVTKPGSVFGRITNNLEGIQKEGRRVWKERGKKMVIRKWGE